MNNLLMTPTIVCSPMKRLMDDNIAQVTKYHDLAQKALVAGNEEDACVFLSKKQELESAGAGLQTAHAAAHENAVKMRELHDKLVNDINSLNARRQTIKAKVAVAETQNKVNKMGTSADKMQSSMGAFERMEEKADRMLDEADTMSELSRGAVDEAQALEQKYKNANTSASVEVMFRMGSIKIHIASMDGTAFLMTADHAEPFSKDFISSIPIISLIHVIFK